MTSFNYLNVTAERLQDRERQAIVINLDIGSPFKYSSLGTSFRYLKLRCSTYGSCVGMWAHLVSSIRKTRPNYTYVRETRQWTAFTFYEECKPVYERPETHI